MDAVALGVDAVDPNTTLLLVLGASQFPRSSFRPSKAFWSAAISIHSYFLSADGFGLPIENLFPFFDSPYDPDTLDDLISTRLKYRMLQLAATSQPVKDLIVYYVGHGSFDEQKRYYLALQSTRDENKSVSSLRVDSLMTTLNHLGQFLRKYVILDACFSGEAALYSQSDIQDAVGQHIRLLPQKGTAFLCSSSRELVSEILPDESNTLFTKAFATTLWDGRVGMADKLSLDEIKTLIEDQLRNSSANFILPEVHTPVQPQGDISRIPLFPNGPRRAANVIAEGERVAQEKAWRAYERSHAEEEKRHAEKLLEERRVRDEEVKDRVLKEHRLEQERLQREVRRYSSDEDRIFRVEAEDVRDRELNETLIRDWIRWKVDQSKIRVATLKEEALEHENEASQNDFRAGNILDAANKEAKSGSDQYARSLRGHWLELIEKASEERKNAIDLNAEAADVEAEYRLYSRKALGLCHNDVLPSRLSFEKRLETELAPLVQRIRRRRRRWRFYTACWSWTKRVVIVVVALLIIGMCVRLGAH